MLCCVVLSPTCFICIFRPHTPGINQPTPPYTIFLFLINKRIPNSYKFVRHGDRTQDSSSWLHGKCIQAASQIRCVSMCVGVCVGVWVGGCMGVWWVVSEMHGTRHNIKMWSEMKTSMVRPSSALVRATQSGPGFNFSSARRLNLERKH